MVKDSGQLMALTAHSACPEAHLGYEQVYSQRDVGFPVELGIYQTL